MRKMGSDKAKLEKKRLKAQVKAEKARAKTGLQLPPEMPQGSEKTLWYRDPNWIRVIVAIASLVIMIIALIFTIGL